VSQLDKFLEQARAGFVKDADFPQQRMIKCLRGGHALGGKLAGAAGVQARRRGAAMRRGGGLWRRCGGWCARSSVFSSRAKLQSVSRRGRR